jgi:hypothetical protein
MHIYVDRPVDVSTYSAKGAWLSVVLSERRLVGVAV